eukprot:TRINITY_DN1185_c0_g1_i4.p1 TRINITY_DN1185_c0_g1~~TRINITY_DN1185_c0_g1_i4.p1  ORF type:complete len:269 (-),score=16.56 TRINITY_DN1185_c0_g1_i4:167-973(-)
MDPPTLILSAAHLHMADVARWRAVDTSTKAFFDRDTNHQNAWLTCARTQFTDDCLFATSALYHPLYRKLCFQFHSMLQRANWMWSPDQLIVLEIENAELIVRQLQEAYMACADHRASSGRDAQVLLGSFEIFDSGKAMFRFGAEGCPPTVAGLPPGVLIVSMVFEKEKLMISAKYGIIHGDVIKSYPEAANIRFTLSVASADPDVFMSCRHIPLILDGRLRASACSVQCASDLEYDVDWPVLCVLGLLEGEPSSSRHCLANAVHLMDS